MKSIKQVFMGQILQLVRDTSVFEYFSKRDYSGESTEYMVWDLIAEAEKNGDQQTARSLHKALEHIQQFI